jgi:hypothetical protein
MNLVSISMPYVTRILGGALSYAEKLAAVEFRPVATIGSYCFSGYFSLSDIWLPDSLSEMGDLVFHGRSK